VSCFALLLMKDPDDHGQYRYLADNQRRHFDRIVRASLIICDLTMKCTGS
jgi:hypothetical protein